MSDYPENDDDFEPTVALAEDDADIFAPGLFDFDSERRDRDRGRGLARRAGRRAEEVPVDSDRPSPEDDRSSDSSGGGPGRRRSSAIPPRWATCAGVTTSEEIDYRSAAGQGARAGQRRQRPRSPRPGERSAASWSRRSATSGSRRRSSASSAVPHVSRFELRLAPGHQSEESHRARQRPRLRAGLDRHPHPRADPGQTGRRGRGPEHAAPHGPPRRHLRRPPGEDLAAGRLARQGHRRQRGLDRPGEDAARAGRRHHRLGQVRAASTRSSPRS